MSEVIQSVLDIVLECVIGVTVILVTKVAVPWMKEHRVYSIVEKFVRAAEKMNEAGTLSVPKKVYVLNQLSLAGIDVTEKVEAMIEAAVKVLDIEQDAGAWLSVPADTETLIPPSGGSGAQEK